MGNPIARPFHRIEITLPKIPSILLAHAPEPFWIALTIRLTLRMQKEEIPEHDVRPPTRPLVIVTVHDVLCEQGLNDQPVPLRC